MRSKLHSQQLQEQQKSKFLPMLCSSSSTKEVKVSHRRCSSSSSSSASASASVSVYKDPSSPRVGCMGQVKRNNNVVGFPSIISFTISVSGSNSNNSSSALKTDHHHISRSNVVKYHKLRSFFSSRSPTATTAATWGGTHMGKSIRNRSTRVDHHHNHHHHHHHYDGSSSRICRSMTDENKNTNNTGSSDDQRGCLVNLDELDPPLPVVKLVQKQEEGTNGERVNLWKRRSGGAPLKSLQLQAVNQSNTLLSANSV